ncbi:hypothetical protein ES707_15857 [subsurface metagenome]
MARKQSDHNATLKRDAKEMKNVNGWHSQNGGETKNEGMSIYR